MPLKKTNFIKAVIVEQPEDSTFTFIEEPFKFLPGREVLEKLLVIDGPCKGQRIAEPGNEFVFEVSSSISKSKTRVTYCLRRHPLFGLVWALPSNKSVSEPH